MKKILTVALLALAPLVTAPNLLAQHGTMAPPPKADSPAAVVFASELKEDKQVAEFMTSFAQALYTQDGKPMMAHLAEKYLIEGYPADKNHREGFVGAVGMLPSPAKIRVTGIKQEGDRKIVQTEFSFATRVTKLTFDFDSEGKLLTTEFISMKQPPRPAKPAATAPATAQPEHK